MTQIKKSGSPVLVKVSVYLSENITTATGIMTQKSSIYLLKMSSHIFKFIFETLQGPWMKVLINERFFSNELTCCSNITVSLDMCILMFQKTKFGDKISIAEFPK